MPDGQRQALSPEAVAHFNKVNAGSGGGLDFSMLMRAPNHLPGLRNSYSQITLIDEAVGRIAAAQPDALIIFTSDHGLSLGHHGSRGARSGNLAVEPASGGAFDPDDPAP